MKPQPTILLAALFALAVPAHADPFSVGFICTIASDFTRTYNADGNQVTPTIDGLPAGSQFHGQYSYDSPTVDGTFLFHGTNATGQIDMPTQLYAPGALAIWDMFGWLTVTDGLVSDFRFCPALGPFDANFYFAEFSLGNRNLETGARGTISWEAPVSQSLTAGVPEGGSVLVMLLAGAAILGAGRRVLTRGSCPS